MCQFIGRLTNSAHHLCRKGTPLKFLTFLHRFYAIDSTCQLLCQPFKEGDIRITEVTYGFTGKNEYSIVPIVELDGRNHSRLDRRMNGQAKKQSSGRTMRIIHADRSPFTQCDSWCVFIKIDARQDIVCVTLRRLFDHQFLCLFFENAKDHQALAVLRGKVDNRLIGTIQLLSLSDVAELLASPVEQRKTGRISFGLLKELIVLQGDYRQVSQALHEALVPLVILARNWTLDIDDPTQDAAIGQHRHDQFRTCTRNELYIQVLPE